MSCLSRSHLHPEPSPLLPSSRHLCTISTASRGYSPLQGSTILNTTYSKTLKWVCKTQTHCTNGSQHPRKHRQALTKTIKYYFNSDGPSVSLYSFILFLKCFYYIFFPLIYCIFLFHGEYEKRTIPNKYNTDAVLYNTIR